MHADPNYGPRAKAGTLRDFFLQPLLNFVFDFFSIGKYSSQETVHLLYQLDGKLFNSMFLFLL